MKDLELLKLLLSVYELCSIMNVISSNVVESVHHLADAHNVGLSVLPVAEVDHSSNQITMALNAIKNTDSGHGLGGNDSKRVQLQNLKRHLEDVVDEIDAEELFMNVKRVQLLKMHAYVENVISESYAHPVNDLASNDVSKIMTQADVIDFVSKNEYVKHDVSVEERENSDEEKNIKRARE